MKTPSCISSSGARLARQGASTITGPERRERAASCGRSSNLG